MNPLDSFDINKKRCKECKEFHDIAALDNISGLCSKCYLKKILEKLGKPNKKYPNKTAKLIQNKYCYSSNKKWFKEE